MHSQSRLLHVYSFARKPPIPHQPRGFKRGYEMNMQSPSVHILQMDCDKILVYDEISIIGCVAIGMKIDAIKRSDNSATIGQKVCVSH